MYIHKITLVRFPIDSRNSGIQSGPHILSANTLPAVIYSSQVIKKCLHTMTDVNEITKETLERIIEGLKNQEKIERVKTSESLEKMQAWVIDKSKEDPFLTPVEKKDNPWIEKGKCVIS